MSSKQSVLDKKASKTSGGDVSSLLNKKADRLQTVGRDGSLAHGAQRGLARGRERGLAHGKSYSSKGADTSLRCGPNYGLAIGTQRSGMVTAV